MSREQKQMAWGLHAKGLSIREIARELDYTKSAVHVTLRGGQVKPGRSDDWRPRAGSLTATDREDILVGLSRDESMSSIAAGSDDLRRRLPVRLPPTGASPTMEHGGLCRARKESRHPRLGKLSHPPLNELVTQWLEELWSPEEIAQRLRLQFPDDSIMQVSHETIYQSLFVQGRGELRWELTRCLRSSRTRRRSQGRAPNSGQIPDMVMISERPAEVADRAVPGHWEGDLIMGSNNRSAVGTLVERSTRFVLLLHLPDGKSAGDVEVAMKNAILTLPAELRRSITWDQGKEMANHASFTVATDIPVYFCDPRSPWQRGSNENTNGLLRQYMPKGTDLSKHSAEELQRIQRSLNGRPRKTLSYMTPSEKLADFIALTA
jgi:IS30 family transposase